MSKLAETNARKYFLVSKELYPEITDQFAEVEDGKTLDSIQLERLFDKIKKATSVLKQIDTSAISTVVDEKTIEAIEDNVNYMYEELLYIQKRLMADEYVENLKAPVRKYIKKIAGDPSNYKKWASNEDELVGKFVGMLTHPDNIETYRNQIRRMAIGTMSDKEFKKIFDATKHKMIPRWEQKGKFQSFNQYKEEND